MENKKVQINLFDPEENQIYAIFLSVEDSERCQRDMAFAQLLLQCAKNERSLDGNESVDEEKEEDTFQGEPHVEFKLEKAKPVEEENHQTWSHNETLALIAAYDNHKENFNVAKKRKFVWQDIANEMISNGFERSAVKCETKWRNLLRTYKNVKDLQASSGRGAGKFRFFDQIDDILGDKPSTSSPHTFSSTKCDKPSSSSSHMKCDKNEREKDSSDTDDAMLSDKTFKKHTPKKQRIENLDEKLKKKSEDLMNMKISYLKKKEQEDKDKEVRRQKRMKLKEKMLEIEEKKVALLEKYLEKENSK